MLLLGGAAVLVFAVLGQDKSGASLGHSIGEGIGQTAGAAVANIPVSFAQGASDVLYDATSPLFQPIVDSIMVTPKALWNVFFGNPVEKSNSLYYLKGGTLL